MKNPPEIKITSCVLSLVHDIFRWPAASLLYNRPSKTEKVRIKELRAKLTVAKKVHRLLANKKWRFEE